MDWKLLHAWFRAGENVKINKQMEVKRELQNKIEKWPFNFLAENWAKRVI